MLAALLVHPDETAIGGNRKVPCPDARQFHAIFGRPRVVEDIERARPSGVVVGKKHPFAKRPPAREPCPEPLRKAPPDLAVVARRPRAQRERFTVDVKVKLDGFMGIVRMLGSKRAYAGDSERVKIIMRENRHLRFLPFQPALAMPSNRSAPRVTTSSAALQRSAGEAWT